MKKSFSELVQTLLPSVGVDDDPSVVERKEAVRRRAKDHTKTQFDTLDKELNFKLHSQQKSLLELMDLYATIHTNTVSSLERIRNAKADLTKCQQILELRSQNMPDLNNASAEQQECIKLLSEMEIVRAAPHQVDKLMANKSFLFAAEAINNNVSKMQRKLKNIGALKEVYEQLVDKRERLKSAMLEDVSSCIYVHSTVEVVRDFQCQTAGRRDDPAAFDFEQLKSDDDVRRYVAQNASGLTAPFDPYVEPIRFCLAIVEAFFQLGEINNLKASLKSAIPQMLKRVVRLSSQQVADSALENDDTLTLVRQPHYLLQLYRLLFEKFEIVLKMQHAILMHCLSLRQGASSSTPLEADYQLKDVWRSMQTELVGLTRDYCDYDNAVGCGKVHFSLMPVFGQRPDEFDVAGHFAKKRTAPSKKNALFKFRDTQDEAAFQHYYKDERRKMYEQGGNASEPSTANAIYMHSPDNRILVCRANVSNLPAVFQPLIQFAEATESRFPSARYELDDSTELPRAASGANLLNTQSQLQPQSVRWNADMRHLADVYLKNLDNSIAKRLEIATRGFDRARDLKDPFYLKALKPSKPLLQSVAAAWFCIQEVLDCFLSLPTFSAQLTQTLNTALNFINQKYQELYASCADSQTDASHAQSDQLLDSEDLLRFFKAQPNWQGVLDSFRRGQDAAALDWQAVGTAGSAAQILMHRQLDLAGISPHVHRANKTNAPDHSDPAALSVVPVTLFIDQTGMSEADLKQLNSQVARTIRSALKDQYASGIGILPGRLISSVDRLRLLATLHESLDWLLQRLTAGLCAVRANADQGLLTCLQELCERCLLVLHLEVRIKCFFYLMPTNRKDQFFGRPDELDADPQVLNLNKELTELKSVAQLRLQPARLKYLFDGIGHMIAAILIMSLDNVSRVDAAGVRKMYRNIFALQQNLVKAGISRQTDLDVAKHYVDLLSCSLNDLQSAVIQRGVQFTEDQYMVIIELLYKQQYNVDSLRDTDHNRLSSVKDEFRQMLSKSDNYV